ncbi:MAG: alpha-glucosidase [Oscillospiraceae bacterium]|nr:alpha-glucosidase [Oscillospiraceae bacterium]
MLSFVVKNDVFHICLNNKSIFNVKMGQKLLNVGNSKNTYKMSHGSFKIKEKVLFDKELTVTGIKASENSAELCLNEGKCKIEITDGNKLLFSFDGLKNYNRMSFDIPAIKDEYIYGGGETFSEFNLRNKKVNVWVAEHINAVQIAKKLLKQIFGIKNTERKQKFSKYETYYAQPTFLSSRKYFFHSLTTAKSEFDFKNDNYHRIKINEISPFYMGFGETFEDVLSNLSSVVGRQPALPDWVYDGYILGIQGGTDTMMKKVDTALESGIAVNGVWIQDWEGRRITAAGKQLYWNWQWDRELYPELEKRIEELNSKGIKVLGYINPFLAVEKPLYKEASAKGYCVKNKDGEDYYVTITTFPAAMIDLTNPDAVGWIKDIIKKNMIDFGFSGWMADFGEYLPTDCVLSSGEDPETVHNTWPALWAKINREALEESGKLGEIMFFTRAGYSDTPKYSTMMWNGDNHVDFSVDFGLPSVIPAMLSLTCCGFGLSHSDIGGYTSFFNLKRDEELYMRWCEMNAFSPVMRGHEGLNPDLNVQFDGSDTVLKHSAKMSQIHKKLKPYIKSAVEYNAQKGVGVVRPLFFYYDEERAYTECFEYMLGRDILVAPVIKAGADSREVYLPDDGWIHLWSKKEYKGGTYTVSAKIGEIPVFIRKEADDLLELF